jgi:hypothetical protein
MHIVYEVMHGIRRLKEIWVEMAEAKALGTRSGADLTNIRVTRGRLEI